MGCLLHWVAGSVWEWHSVWAIAGQGKSFNVLTGSCRCFSKTPLAHQAVRTPKPNTAVPCETRKKWGNIKHAHFTPSELSPHWLRSGLLSAAERTWTKISRVRAQPTNLTSDFALREPIGQCSAFSKASRQKSEAPRSHSTGTWHFGTQSGKKADWKIELVQSALSCWGLCC